MRTAFTIESERGGSLDLLNDDYFDLTNFEAETYVETEIASETIAGMDGDIVGAERALPRPVNIELRIKSGVDVEEAKRHITQVIKPKHACTFRVKKGEKELALTGRVQLVDMPRYNNAVTLYAGFYCSQPYWEDAMATIQNLQGVDPLHFFTYDEGAELYFPEEGVPFSAYNFARQQTFINEGDSAVGLTIRIVAVDDVLNPIIYNTNTGEYIGVNTTMQANDIVIITTHKGNKTVTKNGVNILGALKTGSRWFQMETGANTFNMNSDDESTQNMYFEIEYTQRFI